MSSSRECSRPAKAAAMAASSSGLSTSENSFFTRLARPETISFNRMLATLRIKEYSAGGSEPSFGISACPLFKTDTMPVFCSGVKAVASDSCCGTIFSCSRWRKRSFFVFRFMHTRNTLPYRLNSMRPTLPIRFLKSTGDISPPFLWLVMNRLSAGKLTPSSNVLVQNRV